MATRRAKAATAEPPPPEKDDEKPTPYPVVPTHVLVKLIGFSFAMIVFPISSYFLTVNTVFKGNSSLAGGMAALLANVVLISYVVVAMREDLGDQDQPEEPESKKTQ